MASSGSSSTSSGPVATGSRRRRLVLRLSQKDALQALFQQNPYPGIATRERLARELGIAESRVQVWFQNQRRRRFKQSRSPPEHVHQEGEAGPTSTPAPPSRPPRPQSSSPGMVSKPKSSAPQQSPSGPGGAAATTPPAPEDRRTPPAAHPASKSRSWPPRASRARRVLSRGPLLSSQGPTQPSRVTQPPRGNPGCHGHPGHALVSPGAPAWDEGVEATLEAPLSEEDYQVRASEPAGGTYPPSRFPDHVHVYTRARYASKAKGDVPLIVHPVLLPWLREPPSPQ
nr:double homeobox protein 4C-like [Ovis aries]